MQLIYTGDLAYMIKRKKALMMSLIAGMCLITACAKNTEETVQDQSEMPSVTETASNQSEMPSETETASNQSEMSGETETASNQSEMSSTTETVSSDVMEDEAIQENKTDHSTPNDNFVIEDGVKVIAPTAFSSCEEVKSITIPDTVTTIGEGAFLRCKNIKSIVIPKNVTEIGDVAFAYCPELKEITFKTKK